jgi:hypothetical protein
MNKGSRLHKIFTTPIFETKLELDIKEIKIFCKEYQQNNESATKSNVGGYQSHNLSLETPVLQSLISVIELVTLDLDPNFGAQIIQKLRPFVENAGCLIVYKTNLPGKGTKFSSSLSNETPYANVKTCKLNGEQPRLIINYSNKISTSVRMRK